MTTTFNAPTARGRMRPRSPSEDEETLVYTRTPNTPAGGVLFEQMMRQISAPLARADRTPPSPAVIVRMPQNVFETPRAPGDPELPWAATAATHDDTRRTKRAPRAARHRLKVPSLLFVMSIGIGFGLGRDAGARAAVASQISATAHAAYALVSR